MLQKPQNSDISQFIYQSVRYINQQTNPSPVSPKGEKLNPSSNHTLNWKPVIAINRPTPFPFGKGGGIGPSHPRKPPISPLQRLPAGIVTPRTRQITMDLSMEPQVCSCQQTTKIRSWITSDFSILAHCAALCNSSRTTRRSNSSNGCCC